MTAKQHEKAKLWRRKRGLSLTQMADATGFSRSSIIWFERGLSPTSGSRKTPVPIRPQVWKRYRLLCAGLEAQLDTNNKFDW